MSFTRAKPTNWTDDVDTITAAQINQIDTNQSKAIDGAAGGSYTPSSAINIGAPGGLGVSQLNSSTLTGALTLSNDAAAVRWRNTLIDNATPPDLDATKDTYLLKGTLAGNHDVTVNHTTGGAADGTRMRVRLSYSGGGSSRTVVFRREDTNAILTYTTGTGVTPGWFELEFDGTAWQVIGWDDAVISAIVDL